MPQMLLYILIFNMRYQDVQFLLYAKKNKLIQSIWLTQKRGKKILKGHSNSRVINWQCHGWTRKTIVAFLPEYCHWKIVKKKGCPFCTDKAAIILVTYFELRCTVNNATLYKISWIYQK